MFHHHIITNNIVHDQCEGGIEVGKSDYVTVVGNTVYNNSKWSGYAGSGISLTPVGLDSTTGYKINIIGNITHDNINLVLNQVNCHGESCGITDGEGIIADSTVSVGHYVGRILIANNISHHNGSAGIQVGPSSGHTDVVNNTTYENGTNIPWAWRDLLREHR